MASKSLRTLLDTTKGHIVATAFERLSSRTQGPNGLVGASTKKAVELNVGSINNNVLLLAMIEDRDSLAARTLIGAHPRIQLLLEDRVKREIQNRTGQQAPDSEYGPQLSHDAADAFDGGFYEAVQTGSYYKDPEHILLSILRRDASFQKWLMMNNLIDYIELYTALKSELLALQPA